MKSLPEATDFWQHLSPEEQVKVYFTQMQHTFKTLDIKSVPVPQLLEDSRRLLGADRLYEASRAAVPELHCVWNVKQALNAGRHLARWGCSGVQYNNRLHIFGGRGNDSEPRNSFHVLDLDTLEIAKMNTQNLPTAREGHSCVAYKDSLVLYGGCYGGEDDPTRFNDVWVLDLKAKRWTLQKTSGVQPPGRDGHVAALVEDRMVIYGGSTEKMLIGAFSALNLKTFVWEELDIEGDDPQPRESMGLAASKNTLYLFGGNVASPGEGDTYTNDFFRVEIKGRKARSKCILPIGPVPCPRLSHSLTFLKPNCLALFGGESSEKLMDDVWLYLIQQNIWLELRPETQIPGRIAHVAIAFQGKLLVYGGMGKGRHQTVKSDISILTFSDEPQPQRPKRTSSRAQNGKREMEESKTSSEAKTDTEDICSGCGHNNLACNFLSEHPELGHCTLLFYAQCQVPVPVLDQLCACYANPSLAVVRIADILEGTVIHISSEASVQMRNGEIVKCFLGPQPIDFSFLPIDAADDTLQLRASKIAGWQPRPTTTAAVLRISSPKAFPPDAVAMMMVGSYEENLIAPLLALSSQALMVSRGEDGLAVALTIRRENSIPCFFVAYHPDMRQLFPAKALFYPNLAEILRLGHLTLDELKNAPIGTSLYLYVPGLASNPTLQITNSQLETYNLPHDLARANFRSPAHQQFIVQGVPVHPVYDETVLSQHPEHKIVDRQFRANYWTDTSESAQVRVYHENRLVFCTPANYQSRRKRPREDSTVAVVELKDAKLVLHRSKVMRWNETTIGIINRVREDASRTT